MPRKAKEVIEEVEKAVKTPVKKVASKKTTTKKEAVVEKKAGSKKKVEKVETVSKKKDTKSTKKEPAKKKTTTKKSTTSTKKSATKSKKASSTVKPITMPEYYDLPYRYNQTVVKILAQTPKMLFVYWDISEDDRQKYIAQYGANFFNNTIPFLRVKNENTNFTFDVDVDDFANSWYLPITDSKSTYSIELFRKQKPEMEVVVLHEVYVTSSNELEVPNDHILFEKQQKMVYFRNVKTNEVSSKNIATISFMKNIGKIYNVYDLYKQIYNDEELDVLSNPSSNPSSDFLTDNLN